MNTSSMELEKKTALLVLQNTIFVKSQTMKYDFHKRKMRIGLHSKNDNQSEQGSKHRQ